MHWRNGLINKMCSSHVTHRASLEVKVNRHTEWRLLTKEWKHYSYEWDRSNNKGTSNQDYQELHIPMWANLRELDLEKSGLQWPVDLDDLRIRRGPTVEPRTRPGRRWRPAAPPTPPYNATPGRRGPAMEGHLRHLYPFRLYWHNRRLPNPRPSRLPTISHPHPSPPHRPKPLLLNPLLREGNTELRGRRYQAEIEADIELSGGELWAEWGCRHHEVCAAIPGQVRDVRQLNKLVTTV